MRILLFTRFYPNIGGIETVAWLLAHEWSDLGHSVTVISDVKCPPNKKREFPFAVFYRPAPHKWLKLIRWCDVYLQFNVSLRAIWPQFLVRRPLVLSHHGFYWSSLDGKRDWRERMKLSLAKRNHNVFVSQAIAKELAIFGETIPNPYNQRFFHRKQSTNRECELVFVGRLVSDKGADLLLESLAALQTKRIYPRLTIIGDGPEREGLEHLTSKLQLNRQVTFVGSRPQDQVANILRTHEIMVIPSQWQEPFGVVALEGAACGCVVLGSDGGGLPEAIGPTGLTFKRGSASDLTERLEYLLTHREQWNQFRSAADSHLHKHSPQEVAARYLHILEQATSG